MSHTDPFFLQGEKCNHCDAAFSNARIPCLTCFGSVAYCSDDCMARAYPDHNVACSKIFRRAGQTNFLVHRAQQLSPRKGFPALLQHVIKSISPEDARASIFIIRLPNDPQAKFRLDHPVKKIARTAWRAMAQQSACFDAVWRSFLRLAAAHADRMFVVVYAPDLSAANLLAVGEPPVMQHIPCPCSLHTAATTIA